MNRSVDRKLLDRLEQKRARAVMSPLFFFCLPVNDQEFENSKAVSEEGKLSSLTVTQGNNW